MLKRVLLLTLSSTILLMALWTGVSAQQSLEKQQLSFEKGQVLVGYHTQDGFDPTRMLLTIRERKGERFSGVIDWNNRSCRTSLRGKILGNRICFIEEEILKGSGILVPTKYSGKLLDQDRMLFGICKHKEQVGVFYFRRASQGEDTKGIDGK